MKKNRPYCLSIAGYDPSGGAGVLADIKTFEANKVTGMAVTTGITFQNDAEFMGVHWLGAIEILHQLRTLTKKFRFDYIKLGMVKDFETLSVIINELKDLNADVKIIWDPVLKASAGFEIHPAVDKNPVIDLCKKIFLLTPNMNEVTALTGENEEYRAVMELSRYCHVFLKGGHGRWENEKERKEKYGSDAPEEFPGITMDKQGAQNSFVQIQGRDYLFTSENKIFPFRAKKISAFSKHGSGCVLSSAITAHLAKGESLHRACLKGKQYVTEFLTSSKTLLGYHKI